MHSKIAAISLLSLSTALAFSAGCASSTPDENQNLNPSLDEESIIVNGEGQSDIEMKGAASIRIERRSADDDFELIGGDSTWRSPSPGVWEVPGGDGQPQHIVVGKAGHEWLVKQLTAEVEALEERASTLETADTREELEQQIGALQQLIEDAQVQAIQQPPPSAVSCNIKMYIGPSGPITSPSIMGAASLGQIVCSGGCVSFTITAKACCSGYCGSAAQSRTVCDGMQWTAGVIRQGSGPGSGMVNVNPPNVTGSNSGFSCK